MGIFADSLFTALMSWVRALVSGIWALFTADHTTLLGFLGQHWLLIVIAIVAAGLAVDWLVWLVRWQPYHIWALRVRRLLGMPLPREDEGEAPLGKATAAKMPRKRASAQAAAPRASAQGSWLPLDAPVVDEREAQAAMRRADSVPDEALGAYPGMRYGARAASPVSEDTRAFSAVHSEGPGAAEVNRRRAEIDAWNAQRQEEASALAARRAYEAEQARRAQQAREAEEERMARQAREAEQARLAKEAREAEQARLAQEEYERQMAEYKQKQAQYERDMEEYIRQKAAYDEEMARRQREQAAAAYSDYVEGEAVDELPDAPDWPQMTPPERGAKPSAPKKKAKKQKKDGGLLDRMAKMLETDEEEISGINALPPRVNAQDAYHPAAKPQGGRRRK